MGSLMYIYIYISIYIYMYIYIYIWQLILAKWAEHLSIQGRASSFIAGAADVPEAQRALAYEEALEARSALTWGAPRFGDVAMRLSQVQAVCGVFRWRRMSWLLGNTLDVCLLRFCG